MRILLLDNYDSFTFNLAQLLEESRLCDFEIIKNDEIEISQVNKFDKILLSPGAGLPHEAGKMNEVIDYFYDKKPILGVCLGMQAIAEYFGATLMNLPNVLHGQAKKIKIDLEDKIYKDLENEIIVGLYHSWSVSHLNFPENLIITGISMENIIMSISHKKYDICGVQFHPESYLTKYGEKIIENWINFCN